MCSSYQLSFSFYKRTGKNIFFLKPPINLRFNIFITWSIKDSFNITFHCHVQGQFQSFNMEAQICPLMFTQVSTPVSTRYNFLHMGFKYCVHELLACVHEIQTCEHKLQMCTWLLCWHLQHFKSPLLMGTN